MSTNVLYVCSEVYPYLEEEGAMGEVCRYVPQQLQELGMQARIFMPRYGVINERRGQLHEVIRLSGMNLIIAGGDHQLIIKVASITGARLQVYFIDNEEYFSRKMIARELNGTLMEDNDQRSLFFARGTLETVKKLRWTPQIIHTHGWFSALVPLYLRNVYKNDPIFAASKIVISLYKDDFNENLDPAFASRMKKEGIKFDEQNSPTEEISHYSLLTLAIDQCDAVIVAEEGVNPKLVEYAKKIGKPVLEHPAKQGEVESAAKDIAAQYEPFYQEILAQE